MTLNLCYCGAQAGYPHAPTCPFPLFRGSDAEVERWSREAAVLEEPRYGSLEEYERANESRTAYNDAGRA